MLIQDVVVAGVLMFCYSCKFDFANVLLFVYNYLCFVNVLKIKVTSYHIPTIVTTRNNGGVKIIL